MTPVSSPMLSHTGIGLNPLYCACTLLDMTAREQARGILAKAEEGLRALIEQAMSEQRYGDVAELATLADAVARVSATHMRATEPTTVPKPQESDERTSGAPRRRRRAPQARRKSAFPRFERDSDMLVKVGWSKKHRAAYQHRAPKETVFAFLRHLYASVKPEETF